MCAGFMNRLLIIAILVVSTVPLYAQGQQPNAVKLKADAAKRYPHHLRDMDLTSKDGQEIVSIFDTLDESCRRG
jgi:hypothetical protein